MGKIVSNLIMLECKIEETIENRKIKQNLKLEITEHPRFFTYQVVPNEYESLLTFLKLKQIEMELQGFDEAYVRDKLNKLLNSRQFQHFQNNFYCLAGEYPELKNEDINLSESFKKKLEEIFSSIGYEFNMQDKILQEIKKNEIFMNFFNDDEYCESEAFKIALKYNLSVIKNCSIDKDAIDIYNFLTNKISISPYIFNQIYNSVCERIEYTVRNYNYFNCSDDDYEENDENYWNVMDELPRKDGLDFLEKIEEYAFVWWEALEMQ